MSLKKAFLKLQDKTNLVAKECNINIPPKYYRYCIHKCWKCNQEIIVLAWPKEGLWNSKTPKILPIPITLQNNGSNTIGEDYWVNTCLYCKSIQGDFYLYMEPDGPFFNIHCDNDTPIAYIRDMLLIAEHAENIGLI